ncbi:hypothetical protein [Streptomyces sp. NBC_00986]|uniref:hypothetical protein n=1 Tax=Streptomyces sp. NBC_00986 TaxID=2903702 RepID=UPI00386D3305|nr:hypothetical protein OG504_03550 [Streptomyces sp. NBC_00986]
MTEFTQETVQQRCLYTGESWQHAQRALSRLPSGAGPLPSAQALAQERLDARVLLGLLESRNVYTRFPLGITAVHPERTRVTLCVESEERAAEILFNLLPAYPPGSEVYGVPGLRIVRRSQTGIELRVLGASARLRLTGLPSTVWRSAESRMLDEWLDGVQHCWRSSPRGWTEAEREHQSMWVDGDGRFVRVQRRGAWLGSGLLRRIALLHTVANTFLVDGYRGAAFDAARLVLRCSQLPDQGPGPHHIISALLDPVFGLPLELTRFRGDTDESHVGKQDFTLADMGKTVLLELQTARERPPFSLPTDVWQAILRRLPSEGFPNARAVSVFAGLRVGSGT